MESARPISTYLHPRAPAAQALIAALQIRRGRNQEMFRQ
jgi:hypothetical protein